MVRVGNHSLELVSFETGQTLQEFYSNGSTWVEGIPGNQYYLKITSHESGTLTMAHPIKIDGADIGFYFPQGPWSGLTWTVGAITEHTAADTKIVCKAFRFSRPDFSNGEHGVASPGLVEVTWCEAYKSGMQMGPSAAFTPWTESTASAVDAKKEGVGSLKSVTGSYCTEYPIDNTQYVTGKHLYTITIRYCELAGLVARGIVKAPLPLSTTPSTDGSKKRKVGSGVNAVAVKAEVVDLTEL